MLFPAAAQAQPDVEVVPAPQPAHPDQPYRVVYEVSWDGEPGEYLVWGELPQGATVDWASFEFVESRGLVRDGRNVVELVAEITPTTVGNFKTPPVLVHYAPPEPPKPPAPGANPNAPPPPEPEEPTIRVEPAPVRVAHDLTLLWVGLVVMGVIVAGGVGFPARRAMKRRRSRVPVDTGPGPAERVAAAHASVTKARQCRIDGQYYAYYGELARAAAALEGENGPLAVRLREAGQRVGYTGETPTDDAMDSDHRELERTLNAFREKHGV